MNIKSVNGTSLTSVENKKPIEDYWRQRLQGYQKTPLRIDDGKESRLEKDNQRANLQVKLNQGLMKAINRLSTNNELSVNSIFLGGWALLLSRYSQETDIVFGKRTSSPQGFGNIVPVRVDIEANVEALSWLQKVHQSQQAQIPYESATLSSIQSITDINHKALLFDSLLVLDDLFNVESSLNKDINIDPGELGFTVTNFQTGELNPYPLVIGLENKGTLNFEFDTALFRREAIKRLANHYKVILDSITKNPEQYVGYIDLLTAKEKQQILFDWNQTSVDYPKDQCIHQLFETQVEKAPHAVAVVFEDQQLTYQELNQKSNQLAHYLIEQGVGPDVRVGLCLERSLEMVIGLVGILKAGGAYVPIDPEYPQERIDYIIHDSEAAVILTQTKLDTTVLSEHRVKRVCIDTVDIHQYQNGNTNITIDLSNLVYVIYTSGSTGKPKGVLVNHSSYLNHMLWMRETFSISSDDKVLFKTPLSFDAAGWEWSLPLMVGASLETRVRCETRVR